MRISDWSSDVCSSDLVLQRFRTAARCHHDVAYALAGCILHGRGGVGLTGIWHALSLDGRCKSECAEQSAAHEQALRRQNGVSFRPRMHVISPPCDSGQSPVCCRGLSLIFPFSLSYVLSSLLLSLILFSYSFFF